MQALPQAVVPLRSPCAMYSALQPRTRIPPHTGVANFRLVVHLPLVLPPGCGFRVGSETRDWRIGEAWVFDDTIEHEAWNDSDEPRYIFICDIWNPRLSPRGARRDRRRDRRDRRVQRHGSDRADLGRGAEGHTMFLRIKNVLTAAEVARLEQLSRELRFVDGRISNPANLTKDNLQADPADAKSAESSQIVQAALLRSREFVDFAMPKRIAPPLLCRYEPGMKYGAHADAAIIQLVGGRLRSDMSCTVFVADPATYEGGELAISVGNQTIAFKGGPGEAIVYPSTTLHEVVPVRSGQRLVSITFIESLIADQHQRIAGLRAQRDRRARRPDA